jgi:diguanylate cyclase (GGDEF)-like protein
MQKRTYGILAAGVIATTAVAVILNQSARLREAAQHRQRLEQAAERLCRALESSQLLFLQVTGPTGEPRHGSSRLSQFDDFKALGLSPTPPADNPGRQPGIESAISPGASAVPATGREAGGVGQGRERLDEPEIICLSDNRPPQVRVLADPVHRNLLWLAPVPEPGQAPSPWLQLNLERTLGHEAGFRLIPLKRGAPQPLNLEWSRRLHFDGQSLLLLHTTHDHQGNGESDPLTRALVWSLGSLLMILSGLLAYRSERQVRRQHQILNRLWQDRQTGLLSRTALEQDLQDPALLDSAGNGPPCLLTIVTLRLLERQQAFLPDGEIAQLFQAACEAVKHHPGSGPRVRCYRASETRLAAILTRCGDGPGRKVMGGKEPDPDRDRLLLHELQSSVSAAIQRQFQGLLRDDDIVVTGQRLRPGTAGATILQSHGFGEILAAEAGSSIRLIEASDASQVRQASAIRDALRQLRSEDIDLHVQPILLLANPGQFGLEVLIRFRTPLLQEQPTGELIRIAHELGITHQIDALVIARVAGLQRSLEATPLLRQRIDYLSMNISIDSIASPARLNQLIACLGEHKIDSSRIYLELTETPGRGQHRDSVNTASERLIKELNFRILIDDFGSGLSNYQRICAAWYDTIKLDIDLVKGLGDSFRMQRYLGSFIDTVHALGKTVVAEGVDDHGDLAAAIRLGTDGLQGYLIARPMEWKAIAGFLTDSPWSSAEAIEEMVTKIRSSDRLLEAPVPSADGSGGVPLERYILDKWFELRSFEEFLLLFVNELKSWGLDILRLSLAFLPDDADIDCSQYVWNHNKPGEVTTLRMDRSFLERDEHLASPLHYIATKVQLYRQRLGSHREMLFPFLVKLKEQNCNDYLGLRLDSRGISIPVLTIALRGESNFSDEQIQRICSMSSLLSLLFYTFESERAKQMALLDPLTNVANRRSFDSFLRSLVNAAKLNKGGLALALVDIDHFKQVNDSLGHAYGDACLKEVATILNSDLRRNSDVVARLGGEEFALILPNINGTEALWICERLRQAVLHTRVPGPDGGEGMPLSVSFGVALWDPEAFPECDGDQLQQLADDCLYEAKRQGRNRVVARQAAG